MFVENIKVDGKNYIRRGAQVRDMNLTKPKPLKKIARGKLNLTQEETFFLKEAFRKLTSNTGVMGPEEAVPAKINLSANLRLLL